VKKSWVVGTLALLACVPGWSEAHADADRGVQVSVDAQHVTAGNALFARAWSRHPFRTLSLTDLRNGRVWTQNSADFALTVAGTDIASDQFDVVGEPLVARRADGSASVTFTLVPTATASLPLGFSVTRIVEVYPRVAGMRAQTFVASPVPLAVSAYTLDQATVAGENLSATMHSFRAGADWREPEWTGPPLVVGDAAPGDWVSTSSGATVSGTAQWLSVSDALDQRLFFVTERNDYLSGVMGFDGHVARARVDLSRDVIYFGPLEEQLHVGNPGSGPGRERVIVPGTPLRLEPVFTGLGRSADDEPWQHYKFLARFRMPKYLRAITFNSNGVDSDRISTGAKDDMDFGEFERQLVVAKQIGIETFIFDDGWQARSGDWCPDSESTDPACAEPRRGTDAKFAPRFPDPTFTAVRKQLRPQSMNLGLWMSPLHFNPQAVAFQQHPEWACMPIDVALLAEQESDPYGGSNEAGVMQWNPEAVSGGVKFIDYLESRIRRAVDEWGVRYFKFDFTAWLDCTGTGTVDLYAYRESFMAMLDRVLADHPRLTIQMDETNDYRLFPFEAIARGPTWYQNGSPTPSEALHANFVLAPYVPLYALGRNALRAGDLANYSADYQMAVALLSHFTFFNSLTSIPADALPAIRKWTDYYKAHRADLATFAMPLLADDPLDATHWAAFQAWDVDARRGALLVYRQDSDEAVRTNKLRNLPAGRYALYEAPDESSVLTYTAAQLEAGIDIAIAGKRQARVLRIERKP
jgi:hypothetical protein